MIYLGYKLSGCLGPKSTHGFLKFNVEKKDALCLLSIFDSQKDLDSYLQLVALGKYPFITSIELSM